MRVPRFIANLRLWQKFALVVVLMLPMVGIPLVLVYQNDSDTLDTARSEASGIAPANAVLALIRVTQQHRGTSVRLLSGDLSVGAERDARQADVARALELALKAISAFDDAPLKSRGEAVSSDWRSISDLVAQKALSPADALARHNALVTAEMEILDDVLADSQLALDPEATTYYLIMASYSHLPRMAEALAQIRGLGGLVLTRGTVNPDDKVSLAAQADRTLMHLRDANSAIARALDSDTSLQEKLGQEMLVATAAAQTALEYTRANLIDATALSTTAAAYAGQMTATIDQQFALMESVDGVLRGYLDARAAASYRRMAWLFGSILLLGGIVLALITGISRATSQSAAAALGAATALARGDLSVRVQSTSRDEIGRITDALNASMVALTGLLTGIRSSTDGVSVAAAQIATGNMDLSSRTESQASSLQQTAASMEELSAAIKQSADNANRANTLASSASEAASRGGTVVSHVVETMDAMSASSRKIAEIISVIDGIAFQTNILALNAAVEAARAGDQGRGFAVVASEVRALAQRSALAAREITQLINESVSSVENGNRLVSDAGRAMAEIVTQVRQVTELINDITVVTHEQSNGISQVSEAVSQMDETTQQNAALVEQTAAAATGLRNQAGALVKELEVFKLA